MNLPQNRPSALPNRTDPIINHGFFDRQTQKYDKHTYYLGDTAPLKFLYGGIYVEFPDGRRGVVQSRFTRYSLVRMDDSGIAEKIDADTPSVLLDRVVGWGLPDKGAVVEVLFGERQGELGIVVMPGANSTHVVFPQGQGTAPTNSKYGPNYIKYAAKNLKVVAGKVTLS